VRLVCCVHYVGVEVGKRWNGSDVEPAGLQFGTAGIHHAGSSRVLGRMTEQYVIVVITALDTDPFSLEEFINKRNDSSSYSTESVDC